MTGLQTLFTELYNVQQLSGELGDALFDYYLTEDVLNMANPSGYFTLSDGRKVDSTKYLEECEDRASTAYGALILIGREDIAKEAFSVYEPSMSSEK
mgnify:CR=1 FL=1